MSNQIRTNEFCDERFIQYFAICADVNKIAGVRMKVIFFGSVFLCQLLTVFPLPDKFAFRIVGLWYPLAQVGSEFTSYIVF